MAPSNWVPEAVEMVVGERDFQMMVSQMFVAIKREIPEPNPYPFCKSSSQTMTRIPAKNSCTTIRKAFPAPRSARSPYIPDTT